MIAWSFDNDTKLICDRIDKERPHESAELYKDFLIKYEILFKRAAKSTSFIRIYNMLYGSFQAFLTYYIKLTHNKSINEETDFFVSYCAGAFTGLVTQEIQKDVSDYTDLTQKLVKGLKTI